MIIVIISLSTIGLSGILAAKAVIAGVVEHLEADDIPLSARPRFSAPPQRRTPALRKAAPSRTSTSPKSRVLITPQRRAVDRVGNAIPGAAG